MRRLLISKMGPDPSEVHVLGSGKRARKIKKAKVAKGASWAGRAARRIPKPKAPETPTLFDVEPEGHILKMEQARTKAAAARARARSMREQAFRDNP